MRAFIDLIPGGPPFARNRQAVVVTDGADADAVMLSFQDRSSQRFIGLSGWTTDPVFHPAARVALPGGRAGYGVGSEITRYLRSDAVFLIADREGQQSEVRSRVSTYVLYTAAQPIDIADTPGDAPPREPVPPRLDTTGREPPEPEPLHPEPPQPEPLRPDPPQPVVEADPQPPEAPRPEPAPGEPAMGKPPTGEAPDAGETGSTGKTPGERNPRRRLLVLAALFIAAIAAALALVPGAGRALCARMPGFPGCMSQPQGVTPAPDTPAEAIPTTPPESGSPTPSIPSPGTAQPDRPPQSPEAPVPDRVPSPDPAPRPPRTPPNLDRDARAPPRPAPRTEDAEPVRRPPIQRPRPPAPAPRHPPSRCFEFNGSMRCGE